MSTVWPRKRNTGLVAIFIVLFTMGAAVAQKQKDAPAVAAARNAAEKGDYGKARALLTAYLMDQSTDMNALQLAAGVDMLSEHYADAAEKLKRLVAADPKAWVARQNLVIASAHVEDWTTFDRERAAIKKGRDSGEPGLTKEGPDAIDELHVNGKVYQVLAFYKPVGWQHTHYVFVHYGKDGKTPLDYIECNSADSDQVLFQEKFPKEAAAGQRSYSLDLYMSKGGSFEHQPVLRFYDGDPTYEAVRADVVLVISGKAPVPTALTSP